MIGLIIAISVMGALLVSVITVGSIKMYKMEKNVNTLAQCFLAYATNPESIDIIEDYTSDNSADFNFPNSTGF